MNVIIWARRQIALHQAHTPPTGLPLTQEEVRRGLRISTIEGAVAAVQISITGAIGGSIFLTGFALFLGANSFQLGLMGALPFLGQLAQFVGAYLEERLGARRPLVLWPILAGRLIWLLLLALPFLTFFAPAERVAAFLSLLGLSYALNGIGSNAWMSWMSDMVPASRRGRYFGFRNTIFGMATMLSLYGAGWLFERLRGVAGEAVGYAAIFAISALFALIAAALIAIQPEPPLQRKERVAVLELFSKPLHNRIFFSFTLASIGWAFVTGIGAPFFFAYGLATLQLSATTLALTAVVTSAVSLISQPYIGRLQDAFGSRLILLISILGAVPLPWGWILSTPDNIVPLWLTAIFSGFFWPGITQGLVNLMIERTPEQGRGAYVAAYGAFSGLGTLIGGLVGGALAVFFEGATFSLGPLTLGNLSLLFMLTSLGRLIMALVFWQRLRER